MSIDNFSIPEDFTEFLYWLKEKTESFWSKDPKTSTDEFKCEEWIYGAKWIGLTDDEIDAVEAKYAIKFMPEHRAFLRILHAIDRKQKIEHTDQDEVVEIEVRPFFYNWLQDHEEIKEYMDWPFRTIFEDVTGPNQAWLRSWGARPASEEERKVIFTKWHQAAPPLLPLTSHRFLVSDLQLEDRPVLSVWGSDIIVMGWSLKAFLINEFEAALGFLEMVYYEEYKMWYPETKKGIFEDDVKFGENKDIPYWKEMILYWSSGWSSFGLEYPRQGDSLVVPIVNTYSPENDEGQQKTFNSF